MDLLDFMDFIGLRDTSHGVYSYRVEQALRGFHEPTGCINGTYPQVAISLGTFNGHFRNLNWRYLPYIRPM